MKCTAFLFLTVAVTVGIALPADVEWEDIPVMNYPDTQEYYTSFLTYVADMLKTDATQLTILEAAASDDFADPIDNKVIVAYTQNNDGKTCVIRYKNIRGESMQGPVLETLPDCAEGEYKTRFEALKKVTISELKEMNQTQV